MTAISADIGKMPRPRRYTDEMLRLAVAESKSLAEVMRRLGIKPAGGSHSHLRKRILREGMSTDHFQAHNIGRPPINRKRWHETLVIDRTRKNPVAARQLRRALVESGRPYQCETCGNTGHWNNRVLVLEVDHKNGDRQNNLPENLEFACPNCHSQTRGFGGRKQKAKRKPGARILKDLLWKVSSTKIAEMFGVSDKAVEKWARSYGLEKPPRGYWAKKKAGKI
jgi:5-methylcytosine-specific restriction endonuclease McrA